MRRFRHSIRAEDAVDGEDLWFTYDALPARMMVGKGSADRLPEEIERLGLNRAPVLSAPEQRPRAAKVAARLGDHAVGISDWAVMRVPIEVSQEARVNTARVGSELPNGGRRGFDDRIGQADRAGLRASDRGGSDDLRGFGDDADLENDRGANWETGRDQRVLPKTVIYDSKLTLTMLSPLSGASEINAFTVCVEAPYAEDADPIASTMATGGIRTLAKPLSLVVSRPGELDTRAEVLCNAGMGGAALGAAALALHHELRPKLGGASNPAQTQAHWLISLHVAGQRLRRARDRRVSTQTRIGFVPARNCDGCEDGGASFRTYEPSSRSRSTTRDLGSALQPKGDHSRRNPVPVRRYELGSEARARSVGDRRRLPLLKKRAAGLRVANIKE